MSNEKISLSGSILYGWYCSSTKCRNYQGKFCPTWSALSTTQIDAWNFVAECINKNEQKIKCQCGKEYPINLVHNTPLIACNECLP